MNSLEAAHSVCACSMRISASVLLISTFLKSQFLESYWYGVECTGAVRQLNAVLCSLDAGKVAVTQDLKLRQHVEDWFLLGMLLRGCRYFFATTLLQMSGGVLFSAHVFFNLWLSSCARGIEYGFY